jgi:hypothetical protein
MSFWPTIAAYVIVSIPVSIATQVINDFVTGLLNGSEAASFAVGVVVGVLIRAPLTYVLAGIVLGDVGPVESTRRSIRVFRARKAAAALVALFESVVFLLILIGIGAALEVVLQVVDALGLGTDSGPIGLSLVAAGISIGVFALGTLIFTSVAISIAPQAVMFVGLTRATIGLDHVRPGGDHDPALARRGRRRFHAITLPMWTGLAIGLIGLVGTLASLPV